MNQRFLAGLALAFSLLAPASAADRLEVGSLLVEKQGQGPAVILVPGLSSGPWVWRDTAPRLAKNHAVYLVTLPGFDGRAPQPGASLESVQADLLALIVREKLDRPVLVGHSLGGALSLAFAATYPERLRGVVSVDGLPVFPGTEHAADRKALADGMRAQFSAQTREQFAAGQLMYLRNVGTLNDTTAQELAPLAARSDIGATADFAAQLMALDLRPRLAAVTSPVVLVSPFNAPDFARIGIDEAGKSGYYRSLLPGIAKLDVVSISPARHFVMFDQPEKFAAALDQALADMFAPGGN
jgi:pimeloyl-ACP methyl ester carboxylesterase